MVARTLFVVATSGLCLAGSGGETQAQAPHVRAKPASAGVGWQWTERVSYAASRRVWTGSGQVAMRMNTTNNTAVVELTQKGKPVWKVTVGTQSANSGELVHHKNRIFVAHYSWNTSGATVYALDVKTGSQLWRQRLRALGPVSHSQYRNEVRLMIDNGRLVVFGRESGGRYIEIRRLATGGLLGHSYVNAARAHLPWNWQGPAKKRRWYTKPIRMAARGSGEYVFTRVKNKNETVRKLAANGRTLWTVAVNTNSFCGNAAMVEHGSVFYVVHFCSISTGATLWALAARTGRVLWKQRLIGIGPIGHSKYFNDVQVEVRRRMVLVYGNEAFGRYVEAREPRTGRLISNRSFR